MFLLCQQTASCFLHTPDHRRTFDLTPEQREAFWEKQYQTPGFSMWVGGFKDMMNDRAANRSEEHTSELQSLMRISYAVFCLKKKKKNTKQTRDIQSHNQKPVNN